MEVATITRRYEASSTISLNKRTKRNAVVANLTAWLHRLSPGGEGIVYAAATTAAVALRSS